MSLFFNYIFADCCSLLAGFVAVLLWNGFIDMDGSSVGCQGQADALDLPGFMASRNRGNQSTINKGLSSVPVNKSCMAQKAKILFCS